MDKPRIRVLVRSTYTVTQITYGEETLSITAWALKLGLTPDKIMKRLREGLPIDEVLEPKRSWRGLTPEERILEAVSNHKIFTADQYLDMYGVPKREWGKE